MTAETHTETHTALGQLGQAQCVHGCRAIKLAQVCTGTPGKVHPSGDRPSLCPPDRDCDDAVMHRTPGGEWHTCRGTTPADWYAQREAGR